MRNVKRSAKIAAVVLAGTLAAQATTYAQIGPDPNSNARHSRIVGLWDVNVTIRVCANNAPLFSFPALHKYELGGTGQIVPASNPAALSAHMAVWNYAGADNYQMSFKMFRYDGAGNFIGWVIVSNEVSIDEDADAYTGSGIAEFFDAAGNLLATNCPSFTGTRFTGQY